MTVDNLIRRKQFVQTIANMTLAGECAACQRDGNSPSSECDQHQPFDQAYDDAYDTLSVLILQARELCGEGRKEGRT